MDLTISMGKGLSLRFLDTPGPNSGYATAQLQKGWLLADNDLSLAEEAVGFGLPVVKCGLDAVFPGRVDLLAKRRGRTWNIVTDFTMCLHEKIVQRNGGSLGRSPLYTVKNLLAAVIRCAPAARRPLTLLSSVLRRTFGWATAYEYVGDCGRITVTYAIDPESGSMDAGASTAGLPRGVTEIVVMNEQGARYFNRYGDSLGTALNGDKIGCWDKVTAPRSWFTTARGDVYFSACAAQGATLYRGRELVGSRLAWAGFGYSFVPSAGDIQYSMTIGRRP
jgi:hypothetical protein